MSDMLDFIFLDIPYTFINFSNLLFTPFINILEETFNLNVPPAVSDVIGQASLAGMISLSFIVSVLLFKLIALIIPN